MKKITEVKLTTGIFICAGLAAIIVGAVIFFAHSYSAGLEKRVEAKETIKMSTVVAIKDKSSVVLCAHRGLSAVAPENTEVALRAAGEAGYARVEFDVRETSDGVIVLMHDEQINRMTDGKGKVAFMTFKDLLGFTVDNGANIKDYGMVKVPTLEQALIACVEYYLTPVIEIKALSAEGLKNLSEIVAETEELDSYIVASFSKSTLLEYSKLDKSAELWLLSSKITDKTLDFCLDNKASLSFSVGEKHNSDEVIADALQKGVKLNAWTVNDSDTLVRLWKDGLREFTTDVILPIIAV